MATPSSFTSASSTLTFKDFAAERLSASDSAALQIRDVAPPSLSVSLSPNRLWPPNHQFVTVTATIAVTDHCDASPAVTLVSISSNDNSTEQRASVTVPTSNSGK